MTRLKRPLLLSDIRKLFQAHFIYRLRFLWKVIFDFYTRSSIFDTQKNTPLFDRLILLFFLPLLRNVWFLTWNKRKIAIYSFPAELVFFPLSRWNFFFTSRANKKALYSATSTTPKHSNLITLLIDSEKKREKDEAKSSFPDVNASFLAIRINRSELGVKILR